MSREFWRALIFTQSGDMDLGWLFVLIVGIAGTVGFLVEVMTGLRASVAAWSWLGATFSAVLIAAVPVAKARLLANSRMVGDVANGIAEAGDPGVSTDVREIQERLVRDEVG